MFDDDLSVDENEEENKAESANIMDVEEDEFQEDDVMDKMNKIKLKMKNKFAQQMTSTIKHRINPNFKNFI